MKRIRVRLVTALVVGAAAGLPAAPAPAQQVDRGLRLPPGWDDAYFERLEQGVSPKTVVAVLDFSGGELLQPHLRFGMSDMLITALVDGGRFVVVERNRLEAVLGEQELQQGGFVDPATAVEVGRLLGAELVVHGIVTKASEQKLDKFAYDLIRIEVAVDIRAVHTGSGEIVISQTAEAAAEDKIITTADGTLISGPTDYDPLYIQATVTALDSVAMRMSHAAPLVGIVIDATDGEVMIDLGERYGVRRGDVFVVFRRGDELTHPVSGQRLGWRKTVLARIDIVATEESLSTGRIAALAAPDAVLQPGDIVIYEGSSPID